MLKELYKFAVIGAAVAAISIVLYEVDQFRQQQVDRMEQKLDLIIEATK